MNADDLQTPALSRAGICLLMQGLFAAVATGS